MYTIGEIEELTGVKAHILRYWENVIPGFSPQKDTQCGLSGIPHNKEPDRRGYQKCSFPSHEDYCSSF